MNKKLGTYLTYISALMLLGTGVVYCFKDSFMPYHRDAVALNWNEIDIHFQSLILALMRATAGGFIAIALGLFYLQYKFSKLKLAWMPNLILMMGLVTSIFSLYATIIVRTHTDSKPPTLFISTGIVIHLIGYFFNRKVLKNEK